MKNCFSLKNKLLKEIIIVVVLFVLGIIALFADLNFFRIPNLFILTITDVENLFLTLFTVQASVSTVSIAIVSIINGLINDYILGVSISRYIMNLKPRLLKHNRLIIINLVICMLNYFCVSLSLFNVCITLFVTSIIITILMVKEIYVIFLGKTIIREEIFEYVFQNYDSSILKDLNIELTSAIETGNSIVVQEDFKAIKTIFDIEAKRSNYQKTETIDQLSSIVCDAFEKISYTHNGMKNNQCLLLICDLYKIANTPEENPMHLYIWDRIVENFFRALKDIRYEQLRDDFAYCILHTELYKNLRGRELVEIQNSSLKYYSTWVYSIFSNENSKLNKSEQIKENEEVYKMSYFMLHYGSTFKNDEAIKDLLTTEVCWLHKAMIDKGDYEILKKHFFRGICYRLDKVEDQTIYIVTLIYLYYISVREPLLEGKPKQDYALKTIEENHNSNEYFYTRLDLINVAKTKLPFIRNLLRNWEHMNELEAKCIIIDYVIDDFLIFSALGKFWENNTISDMISILVPDSMFPIYERYFSKDDGKTLMKLYSDFEKTFNKERDNKVYNERLLLLNDIFNKRYKEETIKEGQTEKITEEQKNNFECSIKNRVNELVDTELKPFAFKNTSSTENITKKEGTLIYAVTLSNYFFQQENLEKHVADNLFTQIIFAFIRTILQNIDYKEISWDNKHKQQALIDMIENLSINPSVIIGNREDFWGDEDGEDILKKYTVNMKRISFPDGYNHYFILNEDLIEFSLSNIKVEFSDLTWENIKRRCKENEDGSIEFNVTNDIYLPFTKSEIEEYITNTEKKVLVYGDIEFRLNGEKVGAGIQIVPK